MSATLGPKNMTDWREKEREFLTSLKADTGRDLGAWMRVIAAQNLSHRNDIIDWLRQQGFPFSRASWLERIHHNQGRPIYCDLSELEPSAGALEIAEDAVDMPLVAAGGGRAVFAAGSSSVARATPAAPAPALRELKAPLPRIAATNDVVPAPLAPDTPPVAAPAEPRAPAARVSPDPSETDGHATGPAPSRDRVLAKAKAYRPLAQHLIGKIEAAVAGVCVVARQGHLLLSVADAAPFGLITISAKDIRLVLRLSTKVASAPLGPVKLPITLARAAQDMTHMAVLSDARQLDDVLINLIRRAAGV
jgi:hypothetical protein